MFHLPCYVGVEIFRDPWQIQPSKLAPHSPSSASRFFLILLSHISIRHLVLSALSNSYIPLLKDYSIQCRSYETWIMQLRTFSQRGPISCTCWGQKMGHSGHSPLYTFSATLEPTLISAYATSTLPPTPAWRSWNVRCRHCTCFEKAWLAERIPLQSVIRLHLRLLETSHSSSSPRFVSGRCCVCRCS